MKETVDKNKTKLKVSTNNYMQINTIEEKPPGSSSGRNKKQGGSSISKGSSGS